ncbi:MAG TPA: tetratricopeptide repeat protein [Bdellovibrionota bacterium]|nr:tetratricopeptide repeat protein [Bdellovibrionota bacterium]
MKNTPQSEAAFALGVAAYGSAQYPTAYQYFNEAENRVPLNAVYEMHTGLALMSLERFDEAEAKLKSACAKREEFPECWNNLAVFYLTTKRPLEALKQTERATASKLYQTPEIALSNHARALIDLKRYAEALNDLEKAERIGQSFCQLHLLKAKIYSRQKLYDLALQSVNRAETLCVSNSSVHFWTAYLQQKNRRTDLAAQKLRSMLETFRDEKTVYQTKLQLSQIQKRIPLKEPTL